MNIGIYLHSVGQRLIACGPQDSVRNAARLLTKHRIGAMPVLQPDGRLVGIISERDLVRGFVEHELGVLTLRVHDLMTSKVITCSPDDTLWRARRLMRQHGFRHMPIVEGDRVCGILSVRDVLEDRVKEQELEINVLRDAVIAARHR